MCIYIKIPSKPNCFRMFGCSHQSLEFQVLHEIIQFRSLLSVYSFSVRETQLTVDPIRLHSCFEDPSQVIIPHKVGDQLFQECVEEWQDDKEVLLHCDT